jgi:hypothetical protein
MKITKIISILTIATLFCAGCAISPKKWDKCTKASCWNGNNAEQRMMNMLSPHMPDNIFDNYVNWQKKERGCNTVHLILANRADGEYARYCIYGNEWDWSIDQNYSKVMQKRIEKLYKEGFGIVLWLITDDSAAYARELNKNPQQYINDIANLGLFKYTSTVVIGLEMDEYMSTIQVDNLYNALKTKYNGKIGVHHTGNKYTFANWGDILFVQIDPTTDQTKIRNTVNSAKKYGKPINFFEFQRFPDRAGSQAALDAGAFGVGNW